MRQYTKHIGATKFQIYLPSIYTDHKVLTSNSTGSDKHLVTNNLKSRNAKCFLCSDIDIYTPPLHINVAVTLVYNCFEQESVSMFFSFVKVC